MNDKYEHQGLDSASTRPRLGHKSFAFAPFLEIRFWIILTCFVGWIEGMLLVMWCLLISSKSPEEGSPYWDVVLHWCCALVSKNALPSPAGLLLSFCGPKLLYKHGGDLVESPATEGKSMNKRSEQINNSYLQLSLGFIATLHCVHCSLKQNLRTYVLLLSAHGVWVI